MFRNKRLDIGIVVSIVIHIVLFILLSGSSRTSSIDYEDIREVTLIDQSYRPEVAKVVSKGSVWGDIQETYSPADQSGYGSDIVTPAIDLDVKLDRSQATIDLDRYVASDNGVGDVVKIETQVDTIETIVTGIEKFRRRLKQASAGENVGVFLRDVTKEDVQRGDVLMGTGNRSQF